MRGCRCRRAECSRNAARAAAAAAATSAASPGAARAADDDDDSAKAYLESTVTRALHDAMCALNAARPEEPLVFLGQYLLDVAAKGKGGA